MATGDKLPEAPKGYDKADQDRTRRLIEKALRQSWGSMDELYIYDRVFTPAEITTLASI